jgi:epoxyqueuosine reductase QueG
VSQARELAVAVRAKAHELGFDLAGIAPAVRPDGVDWLRRWLDQGFAGEMDYIPRREAAYEHPSGVLPPVRSVVMLAMNYRTVEPDALLPLPRSGGEGGGEGVRGPVERSAPSPYPSPPRRGRGDILRARRA